MTSGQLGVGTWTTKIQGRGGTPSYGEWAANSGSFGRILDGTSDGTATLTIPDLDTLDAARLGAIREWQHELAFWRTLDGANSEQWVGPITVYTETDRLTLAARDLTVWAQKRRLRADHDVTGVDAVTLYTDYWTDLLSADPSPGVTVAAQATGILMDATVTVEQYRRASDELDGLARTAIDYTAIGRTIHVGGTEVPAQPIATLYPEHFLGKPSVTFDGLETATDVIVTGNGGSTNGFDIVGHAGGIDPTLGLLDRIFSEPTLEDQTPLDQAAISRLALLNPTPFKWSGRLDPTAPITFDQLVPGARIRISDPYRLRPAVGDLRLSAVHVDFTPQGEAVVIDLIPLGTFG